MVPVKPIVALSALLLFASFLPSVAAESTPLELYGLRVEAEYKLGAMDTEGHEPGAWGAGLGGNTYANSGREWVFTILEGFSGPLALDTSGKIHADIWVGGLQGEAGQHMVGWQLLDGAKVLVEGAPKQVTFVGAPGSDMQELTWDEPAIASLPGGSGLALRVYTEQAVGVGVRISLAEAPGWTHIVLPVTGGLPVAAKPLYGNLNDATVDLRLAFPEATTATYHYNWTAPVATLKASLAGAVQAGSVKGTVVDAAGKTLFDQTLSSSTTRGADMKGKAGDWKITLQLTGFKGNLTFGIAPAGSANTTGGTGGPNDPGAGNGETTTVNEAARDGAAPGGEEAGVEGSDADKGSPGLDAALFAFALLAAVLIARRRA